MKAPNIAATLATITLVVFVWMHVAESQGPLTPPDSPAPTMKSLDQIEPRTDLATVPGDATAMHIIDKRGSYYLSGNLDVITLNGIDIRASGVTLDLKGFSIFRSSRAPASGTAILIGAGELTNIAIVNGHITGGVTHDSGAGGDQFSGPGFQNGIWENVLSDPANVRVSHVHVAGCDLDGINLNSGFLGGSNTVEHCSVRVAGGTGIRAGEVHHSTALTCGGTGIFARGSVSASRGESVGLGEDGIVAGNVSESTGIAFGTGTEADGISARNVSNSYGQSLGDDGIDASGNVSNSYGISTGAGSEADGIFASGNVANSYGESSSNDGIEAMGNVSHSYGSTARSNGILASGTVNNSYGISTGPFSGSDGISAGRGVSHSYGITSGDDGIQTGGCVTNSFGITTGNTAGATMSGGGSDGIFANRNVSDSYGESPGDEGIEANGSVSNSHGIASGTVGRGIHSEGNVLSSRGRAGGETGILALGNVINSYGSTAGIASSADGIFAWFNVSNSCGESAGSDGIEAGHTISYSHGESTGSGVGLKCEIAVGCTSQGGESITNGRYLMP